MSQAIAIFHPRENDSVWLGELLSSLKTDYPILITNHEGYQIDALRETFERTDYDEIFFLNETMVVKDNSLWHLIFQNFKGVTVMMGEKFQMFLNKYQREVVEQTSFPVVNSRLEDVMMGEDAWHRDYEQACGTWESIHPIGDGHMTGWEDKHGRMNKVLENPYIKKWKHHWNISQITD